MTPQSTLKQLKERLKYAAPDQIDGIKGSIVQLEEQIAKGILPAGTQYGLLTRLINFLKGKK